MAFGPLGKTLLVASIGRTAVWVAVVFLALYALLVLALYLLGRKTDARALAGFVPDCVILFRRLIGDPRVSRRRKFWLGVLIGYLVLPFDLVPDFIPIAGQLDDAILVSLALRGIIRSAGVAVVRGHWPGPERSLRLLLRLSGVQEPPTAR
jgi:uncharacterized membrane protein YkvA (DUF1232 family)